MSVYRCKTSPFYHYDFQRDRVRYYGSTKRRTRAEAEAVEQALIDLVPRPVVPPTLSCKPRIRRKGQQP